MLAAVSLMVLIAAAFAVLILWLDARPGGQEDGLADLIEQALPRTQCAQCGYPGCRPYAEAVAAGRAAIDQCPPGGQATSAALAKLVGEPPPVPLSAQAPPQLRVAVIDESLCIGCNRCVPGCPVDAIVGAPQFMHTVIEDECTGCELCLPACPVDCITLSDHPLLKRRNKDRPPAARGGLRAALP